MRVDYHWQFSFHGCHIDPIQGEGFRHQHYFFLNITFFENLDHTKVFWNSVLLYHKFFPQKLKKKIKIIIIKKKQSRLLICQSVHCKNTVISPDFLVWKFCGKAQFPYSFGQFVLNFAEIVLFRKISTPGYQVKLRYFRSG